MTQEVATAQVASILLTASGQPNAESSGQLVRTVHQSLVVQHITVAIPVEHLHVCPRPADEDEHIAA